MPIYRKRYELLGMNSCKMNFNFCRIPVTVTFANGNIANHVNASYTTDNKFIQDAIEDDKRFKAGTIRLVQSNVIGDEGPKPAEKKEPKPEQTQGRIVRPAPAAPSPAKDATGKGKADKKEDNASDAYTAVDSVKDVNDAIAFFSEKGEEFSTDEELAALKDKYKVTFPNFK